MTAEEFKALSALEGRRVRITFDHGQEVIATLFDISIDMDESQHLIYEDVEWSSTPHLGGVWYSEGEHVVSCVLVEDAMAN